MVILDADFSRRRQLSVAASQRKSRERKRNERTIGTDYYSLQFWMRRS